MTKTYGASLVLIVFAIFCIALPTNSTYENPTGQLADFLGYVMLALAAVCAALRHAISKLERLIRWYHQQEMDFNKTWTKVYSDAVEKVVTQPNPKDPTK